MIIKSKTQWTILRLDLPIVCACASSLKRCIGSSSKINAINSVRGECIPKLIYSFLPELSNRCARRLRQLLTPKVPVTPTGRQQSTDSCFSHADCCVMPGKLVLYTFSVIIVSHHEQTRECSCSGGGKLGPVVLLAGPVTLNTIVVI